MNKLVLIGRLMCLVFGLVMLSGCASSVYQKNTSRAAHYEGAADSYREQAREARRKARDKNLSPEERDALYAEAARLEAQAEAAKDRASYHEGVAKKSKKGAQNEQAWRDLLGLDPEPADPNAPKK